ncbi:unnamed protein product [Medioppia subpectinata]|uniref:Nuclear receptor domain-containing protein n=1 Tax=Medioppia subpectinata TaxID=1979941 RepID=A0A7R9Q585_9ACAR|nr:unnamed protein product [Medioppia subpectinata]CAG2112076.1 unnamed protein product [Medioppia subpectinata]
MTKAFGAISCDCCKAFFRTFAPKNQPLVCQSNGECVINLLTRKWCKKCRLDKCLAARMRKELIRSKEENERLKQVVINNRLKQLQCNESVVSLGYCNSPLTTSHSSTDSKPIDKNSINTSAEELTEQIRDIENYVTNNIFTASNEESPELPLIPVFRELIDYKGLNQLECNRMRELMIASNDSSRSVQLDLCMFEQTHYNLLKYYYGQFLLVWDYSDPIIINLLTAIILEQQLPNPQLVTNDNLHHMSGRYGSADGPRDVRRPHCRRQAQWLNEEPTVSARPTLTSTAADQPTEKAHGSAVTSPALIRTINVTANIT